MRRLGVSREARLRSSPQALWPFVSDSERLNRATGRPPMELRPRSGDGAERLAIRTVLAGKLVEGRGQPFEWTENEFVSSVRHYDSGPVARTDIRIELEPAGDGATLRVSAAVDTRSWLLAPLLRRKAARGIERMCDEIVRVDQRLLAGHGRIELSPARCDVAALARARTALERRATGPALEVVRRVVEHVETADDVSVERIRPHVLADAWGLDRRLVLTVCLDAVLAGLLELSWDMICPSCRTGAQRYTTLDEVEAHGRCHLCDLGIEVELDRTLEAVFRPTPAVRAVDGRDYCTGPWTETPHVVSQRILPSGGAATLPAPSTPGEYRVFVRGGAVATCVVAAGHPEESVLQSGGERLAPLRCAVRPGGRVIVHSHDPGARHVKLERLDWKRDAATAHEVSILPGFRTLFSSQVVRRGVKLRVARVAILFADLAASMRLYSDHGDGVAFRVVQDHFDSMRAVIEAHRGATVKTLGDAVMAAFVEEADAIAAARAMHAAFAAFVARTPEARHLGMRIGVAAGASYAATINGLLDYFGQTVNLASRLQLCCEPGDIAAPEGLLGLAVDQGWVPADCIAPAVVTHLKGLDAPVQVACIRAA